MTNTPPPLGPVRPVRRRRSHTRVAWSYGCPSMADFWSACGGAERMTGVPRDVTPLPDLVHGRSRAGPVRERRPIYVDLLPPCNAGYPAGGMMRYGIPAYRMPRDILDGELDRIGAMGVGISGGHRVEDLDAERREGGFDAAFVAVGAHLSKRVD